MANLIGRTRCLKVLLPVSGAAVAAVLPITYRATTQTSALMTERGIGELLFMAIVGFLLGSGATLFYQGIVLRRQFRQSGPACLHCGYPFRPLSRTGRCPECGARFERALIVRGWRELLGSGPPARERNRGHVSGRT